MVSQSSCPSIGILTGGRGGWNNCVHIFAIPILQSLNSNTQTLGRLNTTTLRAAPAFSVVLLGGLHGEREILETLQHIF